jgi:predicted 3-demethylubiquinone-9 3-methyltransferase (glyoxalase superfamily)
LTTGDVQKITTLLMFDGRAEEAINLYIALFDNCRIVGISRYDENGPGEAGKVMHALFELAGQEFMAIDSAVEHDFTFTPATSLFVNCESNGELERVFGRLAEGGSVFMPLGSYGFSQRFGWLADKFGVSWQLNLP